MAPNVLTSFEHPTAVVMARTLQPVPPLSAHATIAGRTRQTGASMCGIIAVLSRPVDRVDLPADAVVERLDRGVSLLRTASQTPTVDGLVRAAVELEAVADDLRGPRGVRFLLTDVGAASRIRGLVTTLVSVVGDVDAALEQLVVDSETEARNAAAVRCRDAAWAIDRDRLGIADGVAALAGRETGWAAIEGLTQVEQALRAIDRLEVRGRDSAGVMLLVRGHGLDPADAAVGGLLAGRTDDLLLRSGTVRLLGDQLAFVYKAAAEIGELGDNTAALRAAVARDDLLHLALAGDTAHVVVLGHTRWASVGIISEANAHPLDSGRWRSIPMRRPGPSSRRRSTATSTTSPTSRRPTGLAIWPEITTDAKVIPTLVSRRIGAGDEPLEAFRATVASFEGSVAIAATWPTRPTRSSSPCAGQGQALYVGLADDAFIVASRALRPGRGDRRATSAWTARRRPTPTTPTPAGARSSCSTATRPAASTASSGSPTTAPRCR